MALTKTVQFKDLDITFARHPVTKQLNLLKNEDAVIRSVRNIILTNRYERPYKPLLGANIRSKLFENFDSTTEYVLRKDIETAIGNYEPRADITEINIDQEDDANRLHISITFFIINQSEPVSLNFFVERTR